MFKIKKFITEREIPSKIFYLCLIPLLSIHCTGGKGNNKLVAVALLLASGDFSLKSKSSSAKILQWKFGDNEAAISGTDIKLTFPYLTDITKLKADVKISTKATISPDPNQITDYTNPLHFTVTAEDGTTKSKYRVSVQVEDPIIKWTGGWRDDDAYSASINQSTGKISIDLDSADFDTKVILSDGVSISPAPQTINDWTTEKSFTIKKNGKSKTYKVKVKVNGKDIIKVTNADIKATINSEVAKNGKNANYNYIDVSAVTNMKELFKEKYTFNGDISKWNVSKVTDMSYMFFNAQIFNQDIGNWNVSKVTNMAGMFYVAAVFNQDIGDWDVSKVTNMQNMFDSAYVFDQDIGNWNVSKVTNMYRMFSNARAFNQDIGNWNVYKVTNMQIMFSDARAFNQNIGNWDVSKVVSMKHMFNNARAFNQNIGNWDVSSVINMEYMFYNAKAFNQNIGNWDVSSVINMEYMFDDAKAFDQDLSAWKSPKTDKVMQCTGFSEGASNWAKAKPTFKNC